MTADSTALLGALVATQKAWERIRDELEEARVHVHARGGGKILLEVNVDSEGVARPGTVSTTIRPRAWREGA